MNKSISPLYILAAILVICLLLLTECYIMAIVFGLICLVAALSICIDDSQQKDTQRKTGHRQKPQRGNKTKYNKSQYNKTKYNKNRSFDSNHWNGFSDPNDFPTDGCGNNGW